MTIVWLPITSDDASTVSNATVEEHAPIRADVVPVTETIAPAVNSDVSVVLDRPPMDTKMEEEPPLGVNKKPSMDPLPL